MYNAYDIHLTFANKFVPVLNINNSQFINILSENFRLNDKSYNEEQESKFWYFIENGESKTKDDYFEIKKIYFKTLGLDLNKVKKTKTEKVANDIKHIILKKIFSDYMIGEKPYQTIWFLVDYILNSRTVEVYYEVYIDYIPIDSSRNSYRIIGEVLTTKENEKKHENKIEVNYNYILDYKFDELNLNKYLDTVDIQDYLHDEIKVFEKDGKIFLDFHYDERDHIDETSLNYDLLAKTKVTFCEISETWEKYLYESVRLFIEKKYQTSFLVAFSAMDSLIEFILYCFQKYIDNLNIEPNFSIDSFGDLYKLAVKADTEFVKSKLLSEHDYFWYLQYVELMNPSRRLIDEKLKQILKIMFFNNTHEKLQCINDYFKEDSINYKIQKNLSKLESIRNKLAHGDIAVIKNTNGLVYELKENDEAYIQLYAELLTSFANLLSLIEGFDFYNNIIHTGLGD
ncbi:hypothetical protein K1I69_04730 [Streptococcus parasanguinis]|uniref:hypothetical protein n=1 Tax=Streptococcus parasanguinis TaxID=1318 RepID=UPI001CC0DBAB|nr:hypothetical protein [Streptococcus parasanguinis]MBZ2090697.1 hypothetical protein [Streptococcus parasanguinis]